MKKLNFILLALFALIFSSCNNKVDLYSDKGESTIVYFLLDTSVDTNFVKITKSFIGNATVMAQNYDACNYKVGEIDVKLVKLADKVMNNDTLQMNPIQKWLPYDPNSMFYSGCYQTYYYTTEKLVSGEKYKLVITRNDGVVVTSEAKTIDDFGFRVPNPGSSINFTASAIQRVKWANESATSGNPKTNAAMFEVVAYFRYDEVQPGATDTVEHEIKWTFGRRLAEDIFNSDEWLYAMPYTPNVLYNIIGNDTYLKNNSPHGVKRYIKKIRYEISAIGDELYNYMIINNSSSAIQDTPEYTNIENGMGLMSARVKHSEKYIINDVSRKKIVADFPDYGFVYDPNLPVD